MTEAAAPGSLTKTDVERQLADAVPHGMAAILGPEGASCSFEGVKYEADEDGLFVVPIRAVTPLAAHGFVAI
jgi:hypothetical protein